MGLPFKILSEGYTLQGRFHIATGEPPYSTVALLPGLPGKDLLGLDQRLPRCGINVVTFNYRGTRQSEGTYSLRATLEGIQAVVTYLYQDETRRRFQIETGRLVLGGYSYGGGMALAYAASHPEIRRVCSIAGTDHGEFARTYLRDPHFAEMVDAMFESWRSLPDPIRYASRSPGDDLLRDPDPYDLRLNAPALADREVLLIGGWDDPFVTMEDHILPFYRALVDAGAQRVRIVAFQDDHGFSKSRERAADTVVDWVKSS